MTDDEIMDHFGWTIECNSPLEVTDNKGNFGKNFPAQLTIEHFRAEYETEQRENREKLKRKTIDECAKATQEINDLYIDRKIDLNEFIQRLDVLSNSYKEL